ncbi:hypothetical protein [Hymenobacter negativus]|uniref:Uncharacterized protein n=1 Tax=Hymenobacter negativus TaxID=2795026 RepID=A0ABS3Q9J9_9BACT|nr:hypothetical protein [Hymenobacter negativus]MBO2007919.1 hypothetical protein [Hymenobacter negativus]
MSFFIHQRSNGSPVAAAQWFPGQHLTGVADESPSHPGGDGLLPSPPHAYLITPQGRFTLFAGDWVITEPEGRMHVCHDHLFRQNYLPAEEQEELRKSILLAK